ncbi:MAG TPA: hypothetical protein VD932_02625 [Aquabacterium sp.]|nr:hypothetical protein [Aquabacterium sp.]
MPGSLDFVEARWRENSAATVYGILTARDGSGDAIDGKGRYLKQADISSITYAVWDDDDLSTAVATGTVTKTTSIFDTPQTSALDPVWKYSRGYNFRHDLGPSCFPTGDRVYTVEYKITTTGGTVSYARFRGKAYETLTE